MVIVSIDKERQKVIGVWTFMRNIPYDGFCMDWKVTGVLGNSIVGIAAESRFIIILQIIKLSVWQMNTKFIEYNICSVVKIDL